MFATRFASFSSSNSRWNARSRLNACTTAMPATDSASCAVTAAMRVRTSANATCERRWNQRVTTIAGRQHERAPRGRGASRAGTGRRSPRSSVSVLTTSVVRPCVEDVGEGVDVARQARDDPAGLLLARSSAATATVRWLEQVAAQLEHHPLADRRRASATVAVPSTQATAPIGDVGDHVDPRAGRSSPARDAVVDRVADDVPAARPAPRPRPRRAASTTARRRRRPSRVPPEAREPGARSASCRERLLAEQRGERAAGPDQVVGEALLDDLSRRESTTARSATSHRREPLGRR